MSGKAQQTCACSLSPHTGLFIFGLIKVFRPAFFQKRLENNSKKKITSSSVPARSCRPCTAAEQPEWSRCRQPAGGSPGKQSACAVGQRRCCSGYGPAGSCHSHPCSGCADGVPGHRPGWSSCKPQSTSAGAGSKPQCRSSSP